MMRGVRCRREMWRERCDDMDEDRGMMANRDEIKYSQDWDQGKVVK